MKRMTVDIPIQELALPQFKKEKRDLCKDYSFLDEDFLAILSIIKESPCNNRIVERVSGLGKRVTCPVFKVRKFKSRNFPKDGIHSGFRVIYIYSEQNKLLIFTEIYHKNRNRKTDFDRKRVINCFDKGGKLKL